MGRLLPMGLNIKNERVCALARDVARRTGQNQTAAIESALERYLAELLADTEEARRAEEAAARAHRVSAILRDVDALMSEEDRAALRTADEGLYDDAGLPA